MDSFDSILYLLKSVGIYSLHENSLVLAEMKAYSNALNAVYEKTQTLLDDGFYDTVLGEYTNRFEAMYGFPPTRTWDADASEKSAFVIDLIKKREQISDKDFTVSGVEKCLSSLGVNYTYTESSSTKHVNIQLSGALDAYHNNINDVIYLARDCVPYHSTATINYSFD